MAAKLQCEICGGKLIGKPGGIFECENCGSEYSTEWAKAKIQEITGTVKVEGTVEVTGMVQVDNHANKAALLERGNLALEDGEFENAEKLFNKVLNMDAKCGEAYLGLAMAEAWTSTREEYAAAYTAANSGLRGEKNAARARQFDPELAKWFAELDEQIRRAGERAIAESQEKEEAASHKRKQLLIDAVSDAMAELKDSKQTLEAKLKEAKQRATELDQLCQSFNTIQKQTEELKVSLASLHEQKNQLTTKREKLGLFTGREKKRIDAELAALDRRIGNSEAERTLLREKLKGFMTLKEVEEAKRKAKQEVGRTEEAINEKKRIEEKGYTYEEALNLLKRDKLVLNAVLKGVKVQTLDVKVQAWIAYQNLTDSIVFGHYPQRNGEWEPIEWQVLAKENNRILIISKYVLDCQQYNTKRTNITWEKCSLRKWLNGAFVKEAFSKEERELIPKITVSADKNPDYNTNAGKDTEDQVFLLSIAEADRYFASDEERKCRPTTHAIAQGCKPDMFIGTCWWWLRSPGSISYYAAGVLSRGSVYCDGHSVDRDYNAVRPALWINLDS